MSPQVEEAREALAVPEVGLEAARAAICVWGEKDACGAAAGGASQLALCVYGVEREV